jgi:hypothetical protein
MLYTTVTAMKQPGRATEFPRRDLQTKAPTDQEKPAPL